MQPQETNQGYATAPAATADNGATSYQPQPAAQPVYAQQPGAPAPVAYAPHPGQPMYVQQPGAPAPMGYAPQAMVQTSPREVPWMRIMEHGLFGCLNDIPACLYACFCPCCSAGSTQAEIGNSCLCGCLCYGICCGCNRSNIQAKLQVTDRGCLLNSCVHMFCWICALTQEARAVKSYTIAGKPTAVPQGLTM